VPEDETSSENCLHCEINDVVREHIEGQKKVDIVNLAARMAESLVELILFAPEEEQGKLLAATIAHLGNAFLEKSGAIEGDSIMRADGDSGLASFLVLRKKKHLGRQLVRSPPAQSNATEVVG
jgi:hypothetical protein